MNNTKQDFTILVVDDVATNVMLVQAILRKEGYSILTTDSGAKALRIVSEKHPNLILLDIMMPEMDGYEVLQHLKGNPDTKDIPVIIMSALRICRVLSKVINSALWNMLQSLSREMNL